MSTNPRPDQDRRPSPIDRRWALVAVVAVVILLVSAVGLYAFLPRDAGTPAGSPGDQSPYAQLFAQVGPNGEVTKEMALEAFSLAIAPLPGVTVPDGAPPTDAERADGTFAVDWLWPYVNQLTADQTAVVSAALAADPAAPLVTPGLAAVMLVQPHLAAPALSPIRDALTGYADDARKAIAQKLGRALGLSWSLSILGSETAVNGKAAYAYTAPVASTPLGYVGCTIHVNPSLLNLNAPDFNKTTMAHEMFHCFQHDLIGNLGKGFFSTQPPDWIIEGQAEWAGENIGGATFYGTAWWDTYLTTPAIPLFTRTYDAIGFYQHLSEEGTSPWSTFDATITAWENGSNADFANTDAFKAAGAAADTFLDTWASGYFRDSSLGIPWYATGPWPVTDKANVPDITIGPDDSASRVALPETNGLWTVNAEGDIIEVRGQNHVRMHVGSVPELPVDQRWLCVRAAECKCPPGQSYSGPELEDTGGDRTIDFGITGSLDGAKVIVTGHSLDEFCKPPPSENPQSCTSNCGNSNGDPHLRTINRYRYDFQAAGEFVLLRNEDSSVEIQVRQEPFTSQRFPGVSINTAISAIDNGHKISVYASDAGLALHVDGQPANRDALPDLGAGAAVKTVKNGFEIDFPDGTVVDTLSVAPWGISSIVTASPSLLSGGMGLLGPITPGNMGVPALPDGTQLPVAPDAETRAKTLYGQFADAWRVTDATSLFDYDPDKSTASYTDRNFPSDADRHALDAALASPDPAQQAAAQTACARVTDADLKTDCEYDVFATGEPDFAQQYGAVQDLYDSGISEAPPSEAPASPGEVTGAQKLVELQDLVGSTIGPDNTLYVAMDTSAGANELLAIDPTTAAIKQQVPMRVATDIHFAAGSVWAAGQTPDANGGYCTVTRYDPGTLADQGDYPLPCAESGLKSMGDAVWFIDTTKVDPNTGNGALLTQFDPSTNAPGRSVPLGYAGGCCHDSLGALFCSCGQSDVWRLTDADTSFVDLGNYGQFFPAGTGFWTDVQQQTTRSAGFVDGPGGPTAAVPLTDQRIVGGDPTGVYLQSSSPDITLYRQPADGSSAMQLAKAPVSGSGIDETDFDYLSGGFPWFATEQGYAHLWLFKETPGDPLALWLQWAPLP